MIDDVASLLWVINLGCIDLNQRYAKCDDVDRPDYVHFDLDPGAGADRTLASIYSPRPRPDFPHAAEARKALAALTARG